ncbi:cordon-bleu protein-like 1 isoform X3 [Cuculus canorus]|uniref:cordon-bleu protein-like 1 isoform X3 n=1 Tax=Cuculus canorus TaxID=55661 RepID=UPI0023AABA77|nr:cordon-bleu protein-like 1 isoform X3 [Cuculus canorus]
MHTHTQSFLPTHTTERNSLDFNGEEKPLLYWRRKSKAPPPPSETKPLSVPPFDDAESASLIMEQKEKVIDKDIELSVVLPGDVIKYTTVNGRKPMMDLLIFLCAQYHLNPSSHTIELVSADNNQIKFKPNTPVGMLEVEKVIVKPKQMDKKKPAPVIPEQTVRVVINYKKTQKTVVRVSPHLPLQELIPIICSKCEFDPSHTLLLKNYQSQEPLDVTKSLNDLGLRELYAMDISRDSYQSENLDVLKEKENKGFFSFFQRSKKKKEQAASAPATPLMSKPRPTFITRSNTVSKQYDSNTLPSEMPKKRRAPLPPMPNSQSAPQELAQAQVRPASGIAKSNSLDRNEQATLGLVRKGSLPLSDTASLNSSLRRMKRKAPSPPCRAPEDQSESSNETVTESTESAPYEVEERATEIQSETGVRSSEYNLEEIDEREEMSVQQREDSESTNSSLGIGGVTAASSSAEVPLETAKNDPASSAPVPGDVSVDNSQIFKEEKQENMSTDGKGLQTKISSEQAAFEKDRKLRILDQNKTDDHRDTEILPTAEEGKELQTAKIKTVDFRENNKIEVDRLSNCQACKNDISVSRRNYPQLIPEKQDQKTNQTGLDTVKTQDVAIQTGPSETNLGRTTQKAVIVPQVCESSTSRGLVSPSNTDTNTPLLQVHGIQEDEDTSTEQNFERQEVTHEKGIPIKDQGHICINGSSFASPETTAKNPHGSPVKGHHPFRQDTKPKPKPANEITRDYIPKIGMTTYKIVPPKSLEIMKSWESEVPLDHKDQEVSSLENSLKHEGANEFTVEAEIPHLPKSMGLLQVGSQNEPAAANDLLHRVNSLSEHVVMSGPKIITESKQTETESSKQHVPLMLSLDNRNASSETQSNLNALSPTTKPSSFYLQMQRRASGHYVTSAIARSTICAPNSIKNEAKNAEMEIKISSPDPTSLSLHRTSTSSCPADEEKVDDGKNVESSTSPVKSNKPLSFSSCPPAPLNLSTLRTFVVPKPYSSSRPSPFALAVSSAVKRSQSFNKTRTITSQALREEFPIELSSAASTAEFSSATSVPQVKNSSLQTITGGSQNSLIDKKSSTVNSEQKSQAQSGASTDHHPPPVTKKQTGMVFQRSDPEQIHQSLLAAIRSGEAAAKLKRVGPPSNTISVNGRARLTHLYSTEAKTDH